MVDSSKAFSGFSVDDLDAAETFYRERLDLRVNRDAMGFIRLVLDSGAEVLAYPKPDHVPATFTVLNFPVDDVDAAVDALVARGVAMLHYDGSPQDAKGVMRGHGPDIAWFADPAGNVFSIVAS
ncbi:hypothetical protein BH09ACT10_BH09ACT10_05870 [soil metagenome]